jgi:dTDP-4-dehydrorhamnose 3,5-epimerase-like enzyme
MKKIKIKTAFRDNRGSIKDLFYKERINHVAHIITKKKGVIRGNHYHKKTTQFIYIVSGSLNYWYKKLHSSKKAMMIRVLKGEIVKTPPYEIHALTFDEKNEFIVFSKGLRGGKDYEKDTFRVAPINKHN